MRHSVLYSFVCCSSMLSAGNRFLVSIQQHKMSLSGGRERDEYIHLYSVALCAVCECVCVSVLTHTTACVCASVVHTYECDCVCESVS